MATDTVSASLARLNAQFFEEIASMAFDLDALGCKLPCAHEDPDGLEKAMRLAREAIRKIGWLADTGALRNGGSSMLGGPEEWFFSPTLLSATCADAAASAAKRAVEGTEVAHG